MPVNSGFKKLLVDLVALEHTFNSCLLVSAFEDRSPWKLYRLLIVWGN